MESGCATFPSMITNYHTLDTIREIHAEVTNKCNAACPMCARNHFGGSQRDFELSEWDEVDGDRVFVPLLKNLRNVLFCGTHGDPAAAKYSLEYVESVKRNTGATVEFYSNGSLRPKSWWHDLGKLLQRQITDDYYRQSDIAVFGIDGLEDTHHLYRRNTSFEKIIENAESFIRAGGFARWDFIVFKHNEHQVESARALALKMGFTQFRIRRTSRFTHSPDGPLRHRVQSKDGTVEYYLEPPENPDYRHPNEERILQAKAAGYLEHLNKVQISCQNKSEFQRVYVNSLLQVHPCCFISNDLFPSKNFIAQDTNEKVFNKYGQVFNSLREFTWSEVLNHSFFSSELVSSWEKSSSEGRLLRCARTCGKTYSPILGQSKDTIKQKLEWGPSTTR